MLSRLLLVVFIFLAQISMAQRGMLFIKKHGYKKVAGYAEDQWIQFRLNDRTKVEGTIEMVRNDSVFLNGFSYSTRDIQEIIIRKNDWKPIGRQALITTGSAAALVGVLYAMKKNKEDPDIIKKTAVISYAPFLLKIFHLVKRKHYTIGKKFSIQSLDLHFNVKPLT